MTSTNDRTVRVLVFHRDRPGHFLAETVTLADVQVPVTDGPDVDDYQMWTVWLRDYATNWLQSRAPLAPGSYVALAVDPDTEHLAGYEGMRCLSQEIELVYVPAV